MEQLANYFGMSEEGLGQLLYTTNSFIAGGAPLAVFQKTIYPDMDLDIFLRIPVEWNNEPWKLSYDTGKGFYYNYEGLAKEKINGFLTTYGYELVKENDASRWNKINSQLPHSYLKNTETPDIEYMRSAMSHFIKNITTYQDKEDRKIQIITLYDCSIETFMETFDLVIIGAGPAGLSASIYASRYGIKHLVLGEVAGGLLTQTFEIGNWLGTQNILGNDFARLGAEHVDRKSTRLNSSHTDISRMPSSA